MQPPHLVLQTPQDDGHPIGEVACDGFYDLPTKLPAYVAIVTDGSRMAIRQANLLRYELRRQILSLSGARLEMVKIPCGTCPARRGDFDCTALTRGTSQNVIVFVGDGTQSIASSPRLVPSSGLTQGIVLTPVGRPVPPLPPWLAITNVGRWRSSAAEFAPLILAAAGLTEPEARVFISYRQTETAALAEQLFEALAKINFDVFVDRFRVDVGADFQQRILQELAHKSMVVVIESQGILKSKWIRYEIAVAKSTRVGILALHVDGGKKIPDIDSSRRMEIALSGGLLATSDLEDVVERIRVAHTASQLRRREMFRQNMIRALNRARVYRTDVVNGILHVQPNDPSAREYDVWLPSRPAELSDFHYVVTSSSAPAPAPAPATKTIVGPSAHLVGTGLARMRWLADISEVRSFDEGYMYQVASAMKKERL